MTHTYNIAGLTCNNCIAKAKSALLKIGDITGANLQLQTPQATITMQKHIPVETLQTALNKSGNFTITQTGEAMHQEIKIANNESQSWFATYKPILLVFAYITGTTIAISWASGSFTWQIWMQNFMAGFFLVFSFFKILDLKGFAENYINYDIIARKWMGWGYVYSLIELLLGIAFLARFNPVITNSGTFIVMTISLIGVFKSVLNKRKIKCACLGAIFNIPMSTVTIIENALMIGMSAVMLITRL